MGCKYQENCGGCCFREQTKEQYQVVKTTKVQGILAAGLKQKDYLWDEPVFLDDGTRRRAAMAFEFKQGKLVLGFNESKSLQIVDCSYCPMLTEKINAALPNLRRFLERFCAIKITQKGKGKKFTQSAITKGDILILEADNGLDIVLEASGDLALAHRMEIFDYMNDDAQLIRFSFRQKSNQEAEPVLEKIKPIIKISDFDVYVAPGMFLQASKAGESALIELVEKYLAKTTGCILDLFCGIGTFSYPLARVGDNKVVAADMNGNLLNGFKISVNRQMLHNVEIVERNLFKYPFEPQELEKFQAVVFDPPRAGAAAQVKELVAVCEAKRPEKIVAISCNPHSFVTDANILTEGGYKLVRMTMVDQFVYSNHSELVALFTK